MSQSNKQISLDLWWFTRLSSLTNKIVLGMGRWLTYAQNLGVGYFVPIGLFNVKFQTIVSHIYCTRFYYIL